MEHHGLGLLCCLRAWIACYHWQKNEFPCLSRHFAGECRRLPVHQLKLNRSWVMQQDNNPNTEVNQQQNGFNRRKYAFWSGPFGVLTSTRLRCCGMTSRAIHTRHPKNIAELKQFCKEEWLKICLVEVIAANRGSISYQIQGFTYFSHPVLWMFTWCVKIKSWEIVF